MVDKRICSNCGSYYEKLKEDDLCPNIECVKMRNKILPIIDKNYSNIIYVDSNYGNDTTNIYKTIEKAISELTSENTIYIKGNFQNVKLSIFKPNIINILTIKLFGIINTLSIETSNELEIIGGIINNISIIGKENNYLTFNQVNIKNINIQKSIHLKFKYYIEPYIIPSLYIIPDIKITIYFISSIIKHPFVYKTSDLEYKPISVSLLGSILDIKDIFHELPTILPNKAKFIVNPIPLND
jgi:hypothetical protein